MKRWITKVSCRASHPALSSSVSKFLASRVHGFVSSIPRNTKRMHWSDLVSNDELPGEHVSRISSTASVSVMFAVTGISFDDLMITQPKSSTSSTRHLEIGGWKNVVRQNLQQYDLEDVPTLCHETVRTKETKWFFTAWDLAARTRGRVRQRMVLLYCVGYYKRNPPHSQQRIKQTIQSVNT